MPHTVIGLDVGTSGVRAAEIRFGRGRPTLVRFGQVALAPGAVVSGEVVDPAAVATALRRLWKDAGFTAKRVVAAVAGARVVARIADLPSMSEGDLASSLQFQVQELIPIPMEEAILDFQILDDAEPVEGIPQTRVLVIAVHRDVVSSLMTAIESAGLSTQRVDLVPLALMRSLGSEGFDELDEGGNGHAAEALVDIGGGVTNVLVHEHGIPRFVRMLSTGGVEITESIVTDLDVEFEVAEALKRGNGGGVEAEHAHQVASAAALPLVEEVRTSLEFWQTQSLDGELSRVVLTGAGARAGDIRERLETALGVPVVDATPFNLLDVSKSGLSADSIEQAQAVAAVAVGLALGEEDTRHRRITLVPREIAVLQRARRQSIAAGAAVAAFAALLLAVYALRAGRVADARHEAQTAEARTTELNRQIGSLADVEALEGDIATRRDRVTKVLQGDIGWSTLIQEVAAVLPEDVWLTSFSGTRDATGTGSVAFSLMGFDHTSTAHWLIRAGDLPALTGLWVPTSSKTEGQTRPVVTFTANAQLTADAASTRLARYTGSAG
jgi:type IV pilus assembly protein PilM